MAGPGAGADIRKKVEQEHFTVLHYDQPAQKTCWIVFMKKSLADHHHLIQAVVGYCSKGSNVFCRR